MFCLLTASGAFLVWRLWWLWRARLFLQRRSTTKQPELQKISIHEFEQNLLPADLFIHTAQSLRQRVHLPSNQLDLTKTIDATLHQGGWLTPVYGVQQVLPEYLFLIARASYRDHQTRFMEEMIDRLVHNGVFITRYFFDDDPRICFPVDEVDCPRKLHEIAAKYPQHRLVINADAEKLFSTETGALQPWVSQIMTWKDRAILNPKPAETWGYQELELVQYFIVLPATPKGMRVLSQVFCQEAATYVLSEKAQVPLPESLRIQIHCWIERNPPPSEQVNSMLDSLHEYLGKEGFYWFSACAVFSELHWNITIYLGNVLKTVKGQSLLEVCSVTNIIRLPWFRYGYMPDWLRDRLIKTLTREQEHAIRTALQDLLVMAVQGSVGKLQLEVAKQHHSFLPSLANPMLRLLSSRATEYSLLRDYTFLSFMIAQPKLAVEVPDLKHLLNRVHPLLPLWLQLGFSAIATALILWLFSLLSLAGHSQRVNSVSFSSNINPILSGSTDGTVRRWEATPDSIFCQWLKQQRFCLQHKDVLLNNSNTGNSDPINVVKLRSDDNLSGEFAFFGFDSGKLSKFNIRKQEETVIINNQDLNTRDYSAANRILDITITPDFKTVFLGQGTKLLQWNSLDNSYQNLIDPDISIHVLTLTPDNKTIVAGGQYNKVFRIELNDNSKYQELNLHPLFNQYADRITGLKITENNILISTDNRGLIQFWDFNQCNNISCKLLYSNEREKDNGIKAIALAKYEANKYYLVTGDTAGKIKIWSFVANLNRIDLNREKTIQYPQQITSIDIIHQKNSSHNRLLILSGNQDSEVRLDIYILPKPTLTIFDTLKAAVTKSEAKNNIELSFAISDVKNFVGEDKIFLIINNELQRSPIITPQNISEFCSATISDRYSCNIDIPNLTDGKYSLGIELQSDSDGRLDKKIERFILPEPILIGTPIKLNYFKINNSDSGTLQVNADEPIFVSWSVTGKNAQVNLDCIGGELGLQGRKKLNVPENTTQYCTLEVLDKEGKLKFRRILGVKVKERPQPK